MSRKWGKNRKSRLTRDKKGRFKNWSGGREYKPGRNPYKGIAIHIGKEFANQHRRKARVGDIVRKKTKAGRYHKGADWYVKTKHGWRDTGSPSKPTRAKIKRICKKSRKGR